MVDPLRTNLKKFLASCPDDFILRTAIDELLDNRIDSAINLQNDISTIRDSFIAKENPAPTSYAEEIANDAPTYTASDGVTYSKEAAEQFITAHNQSYDEGVRKQIEEVRGRVKKPTPRMKKYDASIELCRELKRAFDLSLVFEGEVIPQVSS